MKHDKPDAARTASTRLDAPDERPVPAGVNAPGFGSDVIAETLRALDIPYVALNPGASYRGLHDSLVNYLGNERPQMLLCLHEEHAVAICQGYAKVTGRAMAAIVHSNVGLFHATMAIFNAWCDRMPVVVLGATGPVDATKRRPWIDWIHTARDQGAIVRPYTKWDDQPASPAAAREALLRAAWLAEMAPKGPVYVNLDAGLQEAPLEAPLPAIDAGRFRPAAATATSPALLSKAAAILAGANRPLILAGRSSRAIAPWNARVALAEHLGARVGTDIKIGASFPTDHALHVGAPNFYASPELVEALRDCDAVLSLDWVDLAGTLKMAFGDKMPTPKIVQVSIDHAIHNGWSMDHQGLPPVDLLIPADPDAVVGVLLEAVRTQAPPAARPAQAGCATPAVEPIPGGRIHIEGLAQALRAAAGNRPVSLAHLPLGWNGASWPFRHPLDFLGSDGGGGIGAGPGITVGAALALRGSGRLVVGICGDGDFLMGVTSLWTAVHYRIPLLVIVANNRSFYNDEVHQERMARLRGRPVENKWIGQRMTDPDIDIAGLARAQGALGLGPILDGGALAGALDDAIKAVDAGRVAVIDVRVEPGMTPALVNMPGRSVSRAVG
jgi:thiamine pyrophosphate-dependent acetolactate synthase large subunit-like protein